MGDTTSIAWTDRTFNPWWGCTKVSPGCDNCYAETFAKRTGHRIWGPGVPRRYFGDKHWNEPLKWNREAERDGRRIKVFCASMADVFDNEVDEAVRWRLWELVNATPHLTWQILTKRIGNARHMLPDHGRAPPNVWLGISVVNQEEADRDIPKLLEIPARVRWLSIEPQLGPVDLRNLHLGGTVYLDALTGCHRGLATDCPLPPKTAAIDWVIQGGESGPRARPFYLHWATSLRDQCRTSGAAYFLKQIGSNAREMPSRINETTPPFYAVRQRDTKGGDPTEWPEDLRVREFP